MRAYPGTAAAPIDAPRPAIARSRRIGCSAVLAQKECRVNRPQRVSVYVAFVLLVLLNLQAISSLMYLFKGMNHMLPANAVSVTLADERSGLVIVPLLDQHGRRTGQTVNVLVNNDYYSPVRMLPVLNLGLLLLAFVAYGVGDAMKSWRWRHRV